MRWILPTAPDLDLDPGRQRVGHRHADAVQAAREGMPSTLALVELAAGVQPGVGQHHHRDAFLGCGPTGMPRPSSATVTEPSTWSVTWIFFAKPPRRLVGGVVDHLLDDVRRAVGGGTCRAFAHRLEPFQDAEGGFVVLLWVPCVPAMLTARSNLRRAQG